jgi:radical SAM protein with 4Fe4S-binding SPASM domain
MIDELARWQGDKIKVLRLVVSGEPLLHPKFAEMVRIAKQKEAAEKVDTISNGSLLTKDLAAKLIDYELDLIRFSIYSVSSERHAKVTQSSFDINKIRENIYQLRSLREQKGAAKPYIMVKMFDAYSEENQVLFDMYQDIADEVCLENVIASNNTLTNYYGDQETAAQSDREFKENLNPHTVCPRPFMALVVNHTGDVMICCEPTKGTKIGNVTLNSLQEIWESETMFEFRKMFLENRRHENPVCRNCVFFKTFPPEDNIDGFPIEKLK